MYMYSTCTVYKLGSIAYYDCSSCLRAMTNQIVDATSNTEGRLEPTVRKMMLLLNVTTAYQGQQQHHVRAATRRRAASDELVLLLVLDDCGRCNLCSHVIRKCALQRAALSQLSISY